MVNLGFGRHLTVACWSCGSENSGNKGESVLKHAFVSDMISSLWPLIDTIHCYSGL